MFEHSEQTTVPEPVASIDTVSTNPVPADALPTPEPAAQPHVNGDAAETWHAEAGRKGARRIAELIEEGRRYEKEHGLKQGRQRIRQLIEQGKLYEREHGLHAEQPQQRRRKRLSRGERQELLTTLVHCLIRLAKPSFRDELGRLVEVLQKDHEQAA